MAFVPKTWLNEPDHSTPISAAALQDLEARVTDYADDRVDPFEGVEARAADYTDARVAEVEVGGGGGGTGGLFIQHTEPADLTAPFVWYELDGAGSLVTVWVNNP